MRTTVKVIAICAIIIGAFCFGRTSAEFPELQAAKRNLIEAKNHLNKAAKEFGGHRAKAADAADKAIEEVDKAILYGDKN
jgi:uncharacterized membrane-anchored protein YhcB (DUF1043 family)